MPEPPPPDRRREELSTQMAKLSTEESRQLAAMSRKVMGLDPQAAPSIEP